MNLLYLFVASVAIVPFLAYEAETHSRGSALPSVPVLILRFSSVNLLLLNLSESRTVPLLSAFPALSPTEKFIFVGWNIGKNFEYDSNVLLNTLDLFGSVADILRFV